MCHSGQPKSLFSANKIFHFDANLSVLVCVNLYSNLYMVLAIALGQERNIVEFRCVPCILLRAVHGQCSALHRDFTPAITNYKFSNQYVYVYIV